MARSLRKKETAALWDSLKVACKRGNCDLREMVEGWDGMKSTTKRKAESG